VCYPGKPGSTKAAKGVMEGFAAHLETEAKLEKGALSAIYMNEEKPALEHLQESKPSYGILSLAIYLKWKAAGTKITPIAISEKGESHELTERFHALVPATSTRKGLADLKGSVVTSCFLDDPRFATKIVFAGALDASSDVAIVATRMFLPALRLCADEKPLPDGRKLAAVIVDDAQLKGLEGLPFKNKLKVLWSSKPLPTPPFVAFGDAQGTDLSKKLTTILSGMSSQAAGKAVLETLQETSGFRPVPEGAYAGVESAY